MARFESDPVFLKAKKEQLFNMASTIREHPLELCLNLLLMFAKTVLPTENRNSRRNFLWQFKRKQNTHLSLDSENRIELKIEIELSMYAS